MHSTQWFTSVLVRSVHTTLQLRCGADISITFCCKSSQGQHVLKVDVPILPCVFYTFNWLTLTSEMYFVRFHPEVTSCLLFRGKTKYATLGMRLWCKYIRNYLLVYQLTSHFLPYHRKYKEFEGEISDLQLEKYGLSFETKKYTTSGWARGDENVIGIRAFKLKRNSTFMRHRNAVSLQFLCSRVQCGNPMQLRHSMNGPLNFAWFVMTYIAFILLACRSPLWWW